MSSISNPKLPISFNSISSEERKLFLKENGYTKPFSLNNISNVEILSKASKQYQQSGKKIEFPLLSAPFGDRKAHLFSRLVFDLATDAAILDALSSCLGPDILLWIGQVVNREAGDRGQPWHIDQINWEVGGIHASIALTDMNQGNGCLQVIPKTHLYQPTLGDLEAQAKLSNTSLWDGQAMVALADRLHPENSPHQLVSLEVKAGQCFLTQGGVWHGVTRNTSDQLRIALVARYMRTDVLGRESNGKPLPSILITGTDNAQKNILCSPPQPWFRSNLFLNYRLNKLFYRLNKLL